MRKSAVLARGISLAAVAVLLFLSLPACASTLTFRIDSDPSLRALTQNAPACPTASFAVLTDAHVYDTNLGTTGAAFEEYLASDRKLLRESQEILSAAVTGISGLSSTFVLVAGDLTKDGEQQSHLLAVQQLARLKASGKKIYVVPGNHDIKNGHSYRYIGDLKERVPNITADEFAKIYAPYGFDDALKLDTDSLSYLAEPVPGLWLLALDSCLYRENVEDKTPVTAGRFSPQTLTWIESRLEEAARAGKAVLVLMHHGVVEHYPGQAKNFGEYLVDNYKDIARLFEAYNVRTVFTGHYHAQDITLDRSLADRNKYIFDVETGSLATYPCPYRIVNVTSDQREAIETRHVTSIPSHPDNFQEFARSYVEQGVAGIAVKTLTGYGVSKPEAEKVAGQIAAGFVAHYAGDETLAAVQVPIDERGLSPMAWIVVQMRKDLIYGNWHDLPPPDNNITIDLRTGNW